MDYSLLVGIHHCSETTDEALLEDRLTTSSCNALTGVFVIKSSRGACSFFVFIDLCFGV